MIPESGATNLTVISSLGEDCPVIISDYPSMKTSSLTTKDGFSACISWYNKGEIKIENIAVANKNVEVTLIMLPTNGQIISFKDVVGK